MNDLTGRQFGRLTVIKKVAERCNGHIVWKCLCDCGNVAYVTGARLISGQTRSCGCARKGVHAHDLTGRRFGRLVALRPTDKRLGNSIIWTCQCDCGKICNVAATDLENGKTRSCGCLAVESHQKSIERAQKKRGAYQVDGTDLKLLGGKIRKSNTSGVTGVSYDTSVRLWKSTITLQGKRHYLGGFAQKEDAAQARKEGEKIHTEFLKHHKK